MREYEYIFEQCRKYRIAAWDGNVLRECQSLMSNLTREELISVYRSRFLSEKHPLKKTALKMLFPDKVGKREERIKGMSTTELIEEFKDKKSGNVSLIRKELRERYKAGKTKQMIASIFNVSTKSDQQWLKWQIRKERYGDNNKWNNSPWK